MKKWGILMTLAMLMLLAGCQGQAADAPAAATTPQNTAQAQDTPEAAGEESFVFANLPMVDITEKLFIAQCNDVYLNPDDYQGKAIRLEGMYQFYANTQSGKTYHYVVRNGPGCCGADGSAGFEFVYDGVPPKENDWIEVIGTVEKMTIGDSEYIVLRAGSITVKQERGAEFVSN